MIKRVTLVRRNPAMSPDAFQAYWLETHSKIGTKIPGVRHYCINFIQEWESEGSERWDGYSELWFDSESDMRKGLASVWQELLPDRRLMFAEVRSAVVHEHRLL